MDISLILGITGIAGQIVTSRRPTLGWTIALLNQPLWVVFALATGHHGLLLMTPGYLLAAALNLRAARRHSTMERRAAYAAKTPTAEGAP